MPLPQTITVVIHTWQEERNIQECIENARQLSTDVIVIDMESTDGTVSIAKKMGVPVFSFKYMRYVEPARNFGISKAAGGWVFILDADERLTPSLIDEVKAAIQNPKFTYYRVPRIEVFNKRNYLRHGGWQSAPQVRCIKKSAFRTWSERIHSFPEIDGACGVLQNHMEHFSQGNIAMMVEKTIRYEDIEATLLYNANRKVHVATFFRKWIAELFRRLILKKGFLDGTAGIITSFYQAYSKTVTYLFLFEKYETSTHH